MAIETPDWIIELSARAAFEVHKSHEVTAFGKGDEDRKADQRWKTAGKDVQRSFEELAWAVVVEGVSDHDWYMRDTRTTRHLFQPEELPLLEAEYAMQTQAARQVGALLSTLYQEVLTDARANPDRFKFRGIRTRP